jgi:hypothetical protein
MERETFYLGDLDIPSLKLVRETVVWQRGQDHCRWIFRTRKNQGTSDRCIYFKLWNSTYIRRDTILRGLDSGFYDDRTTPAFAGVVYHNGICRGYATYESQQHRRMDPDFYRLIQERTVSTGLAPIQFSRFHLYRFDNRYTLIDLESIYPINQLDTHPANFDDAEYARFVHQLKNGIREVSVPNATSVSSFLFPFRKSYRFYKRFHRWAMIQWGIAFNHVNLIEI